MSPILIAALRAGSGRGGCMMRGLAPQPRLLWAVAIGAGLTALTIVSPGLRFAAGVYPPGLAITAARHLPLLPAHAGYLVQPANPEPCPRVDPQDGRVG